MIEEAQSSGVKLVVDLVNEMQGKGRERLARIEAISCFLKRAM